jgi:hypothetical protein
MSRPLTGFAALFLLSGVLSAQQASWTTAPTLPSKGHWVLRETAVLGRHSSFPGSRRRSQSLSSRLSYGLDGERAVFVDLPVRGGGHHHSPSQGDVALGWKWRFHSENPGPVDTVRASLSLGATLPTGADRHTSDEVVPFAELAWMKISGRLGLGASLALEGGGEPYQRPLWADETGEQNMRFAGAALWRIDPVEYASSLEAATYLTLEMISNAEVGEFWGESELIIAPGLLYEAPSFAAEISYALPVHSDELTSRPELDGALLFGVRFLW